MLGACDEKVGERERGVAHNYKEVYSYHIPYKSGFVSKNVFAKKKRF